MHHIFIVSDGTGQTAERTLKAALTQFTATDVEISRRAEVRTHEQALYIIEEAAAVDGIVVHTLVSDDLRRSLRRFGRLRDVETIDLFGPLLARLSEYFAYTPAEKPGLFHKLNEEYFRRIESMEFAIAHDDGMRSADLPKAEIVLTGVSRTFKTPLSIYLAFKGWFVANIPIIMDIPPPPILFKLKPGRVFCLTTSPRRLADLRSIRDEYLGRRTGSYADPDFIRRELAYAKRLFRKRPDWPLIDVTNKPIEEISSEILSIVRKGVEDPG
ncbi:MAG: pyruvate, water dikinase regulatory protein [Rhodothermales bacterium]